MKCVWMINLQFKCKSISVNAKIYLPEALMLQFQTRKNLILIQKRQYLGWFPQRGLHAHLICPVTLPTNNVAFWRTQLPRRAPPDAHREDTFIYVLSDTNDYRKMRRENVDIYRTYTLMIWSLKLKTITYVSYREILWETKVFSHRFWNLTSSFF